MKKMLPVLLLVLTGCATGYRIQNGQWVYVDRNEDRGKTVEPVPGADAATFEPLKDGYAHDHKTVYFNNWSIEGADGATFEYLGNYYGRDKAKVFYIQKEVRGADPASFQVFKNFEGYGRDRKCVFLGPYRVEEADPDTFGPLRKGDPEWGRDARDIYYGFRPLHVRDQASFRVLNQHWAQDRLAFYALNTWPPAPCGKVNCDYATMKILNDCYAVDKDRVYYAGWVMTGADAKTFHVTSASEAEDKYRKYTHGNIDDGSGRNPSIGQSLMLRHN